MKLISFKDLIRRYHSGESFVVFDTETTGLNTYHDDIVEVAGVIWGKNEELKSFQELIRVNPNKMTAAAQEIHQIPPEELAAAREPNEVLSDFIEFCGDRALIAHNVRFDYDILNSNLVRNGLRPYLNDQVACTVGFAREQLLPGKLGNLAKHCEVSVSDKNLHRALYDVQMLTQVINKWMKEHEPAELQYSLIF